MKTRRWIIVLLLIVSLLISACAQPSASSTEAAAKEVISYAERSERFALKLPPLYVQYGADGVLSVAGISTTQLYQWTGIDLRGLNLQPWVVERLVASNVQHIEISEGGDGVAIYVNGEPLPYIAWDTESLQTMADLLSVFDVPYASVLKVVLPLVQFTRLSLVAQFPIQPGAEPIPVRPRTAPAVVAPRAEPLTSPVAIVRLDVSYDEEGMPSLFGLDARTLATLGIDVRPLMLNADIVRRFKAHNIQHVHFVNRPDGVHIFVNNKPLPRLAWDEQHLDNALQLYATLSGLGENPLFNLISQVLPELRRSDVDLLLRFPVPEGEEPIPVLEAPAQ